MTGNGAKEALRHCERVLSLLKRHEKAPLYLSLGEGELDLREVESRLLNGQYRNTFDFACDIRKMWTNGFKRATGNQDLYSAYVQMSEYSEQILQEVPNLPLQEDAGNEQMSELKRSISEIHDKLSQLKPKDPFGS